MIQKRTNIDLEIILLLLKREYHLRDIARKLEIPYTTVLRRLNKFVKENIIDYKIEGKNKVFSLKKNLQAKNHLLNAERYKLIKLLNKYPKLSIIVEEILKSTKERMIILFGSYASFTAKKESDIDIYVDTNNKKVKEEIGLLNSKIKVKVGKFNESSLLIKEIINNHIILRGAEDFYEKTKYFN